MCMPKLDNTHIADRLRERLADLKSDKEVAAREIKNLLNKEQLKAVEEEKAKQKKLKKEKIARTKEQQKNLAISLYVKYILKHMKKPLMS